MFEEELSGGDTSVVVRVNDTGGEVLGDGSPHPAGDTFPSRLLEPECPHRLEDVAYAQVRCRNVKFRGNF
jgi:hypothetical protein